MASKVSKRFTLWDYAEIALLAAFFVLVAGSAAPDVNEAHYLAKAKHFWNPAFGSRDFFLTSSDAHVVFYWCVGWLTQLFSLETSAWIGRSVVWILIATSVVRLTKTILPRQGCGLVAGVMFFVLQSNLHMAGEWVIGGVEAKGFAFGLCFLALSYAITNRWAGVWWLLGVAMAFHVLVGGWFIVCIGVCRLIHWKIDREEPSGNEWLSVGSGVSFAILGLWPAIMLSRGVPTETIQMANWISVYVRLPHHLLFTDFSLWRVVGFGTLVLFGFGGCVWFYRKLPASLARLTIVCACSLSVALTGVLLDWGLPNDSAGQHALLKYYWFRTSDVMVPLLVSQAVVWCALREYDRRRIPQWILGTAFAVVLAGQVTCIQWTRFWDPRPRGDSLVLPSAHKLDRKAQREMTLRIHRHWKAACAWLQRHSATDSVVLTPMRQQTFKWYAQRAEIVSRKDMPQDAVSLVRWFELYHSVYPIRNDRRGLRHLSNSEIYDRTREHEAGFVLISEFSPQEQRRFEDDARFAKRFPPAGSFSFYAVYEVIDE